MFCPRCGTKNEEIAAFCVNCGASLKVSTSLLAEEPLAPKTGRLLRKMAIIGGLGLLFILLGTVGFWAYRQFTPQGNRIAYLKEEDDQVSLWTINADGTQPVQIFRGTEEIQFPYHPDRYLFTPFLPDNRTLLFTVKQDGQDRFYRADTSGSDLAALTDPVLAASGLFSPNGKHLVIITQSEKTGKQSLYLVNTMGDDQIELATDVDNAWARFSPDSKHLLIWELNGDRITVSSIRIADKNRTTLIIQASDASVSFSNNGKKSLLSVKNGDNTDSALYITDANGQNRAQILNGADQISAMFLSGDEQIAVALNRAGRYSFGLLDANGVFLAEVLAGAQNLLYQPSRDGNWIVTAVQQSDQQWDIYSLETNGRILTQLVNDMSEVWPDFHLSPDGQWVAFKIETKGKFSRYLVATDGGRRVTLFEGADNTQYLAFSPDGGRVVYDLEREGVSTIYVTDIDGANRQKLVEGGYYPVWSN